MWLAFQRVYVYQAYKSLHRHHSGNVFFAAAKENTPGYNRTTPQKYGTDGCSAGFPPEGYAAAGLSAAKAAIHLVNGTAGVCVR